MNSITRKDVYPLPRVEDILDTLGEAKYFTSLDVASGYWQVNAHAKSAFTTHHGLFDHLHHLREVFGHLREAELRRKPKKCLILRDEVHYMLSLPRVSALILPKQRK